MTDRTYRRTIGKHDTPSVTVTFVHRATGDRRTATAEADSRREALRKVCRDFDPALWRADCISTSQSVYDDLTFSRHLVEPADLDRGKESRARWKRSEAYSIGGTLLPEPSQLGGAGAERGSE